MPEEPVYVTHEKVQEWVKLYDARRLDAGIDTGLPKLASQQDPVLTDQREWNDPPAEWATLTNANETDLGDSNIEESEEKTVEKSVEKAPSPGLPGSPGSSKTSGVSPMNIIFIILACVAVCFAMFACCHHKKKRRRKTSNVVELAMCDHHRHVELGLPCSE